MDVCYQSCYATRTASLPSGGPECWTPLSASDRLEKRVNKGSRGMID